MIALSPLAPWPVFFVGIVHALIGIAVLSVLASLGLVLVEYRRRDRSCCARCSALDGIDTPSVFTSADWAALLDDVNDKGACVCS